MVCLHNLKRVGFLLKIIHVKFLLIFISTYILNLLFFFYFSKSQVSREDAVRFLEDVKHELNAIRARYTTSLAQVQPLLHEQQASPPMLPNFNLVRKKCEEIGETWRLSSDKGWQISWPFHLNCFLFTYLPLNDTYSEVVHMLHM